LIKMGLAAAALLLLVGAGVAEPIRTLSAAGVGVESAALLMSGQQGGDLPMTALALPVRGESGDKARVLLRLRMDGPALLAGHTRDVLRIEASLYALGSGGGVQASLLETIEIDLASLRGAVEGRGVDLLGSLDLRPGTYSLRMLVRNLDTGRLGVRTLPLSVPDPGSLESSPPLSPPPAEGDARPTARSGSLGALDPPSFPDDPVTVPSDAPAAAVPAIPVIPDTTEGRRLRAAVRSSYREALARLAAGRDAEALAAVAALEDSLFARSEKPVTVEQVIEIEAGRELGAADARSLVPLLRLHQRLYEEATVKRRLQGSTVTREVFFRLLDVFQKHDQSELARQFLSTFGVELVRSGLGATGGHTLRRVLAEDPGNEIVLLELAAAADRSGDRAGAAGYLMALLRAHPENRDARLRLILARARLGQTAEAEEKLRDLIREETGGWRLTLAYQELARLLMAHDLGAAETTLREGLARLPGDEKLTLLLAAVLERKGDRGAAREAIAGLIPEGQDGGGAARNRYNRPAEEPFGTVLTDLDREAVARRPALAAALEKTAP
jgi:Tfp pilus assembly protein PilF